MMDKCGWFATVYCKDCKTTTNFITKQKKTEISEINVIMAVLEGSKQTCANGIRKCEGEKSREYYYFLGKQDLTNELLAIFENIEHYKDKEN